MRVPRTGHLLLIITAFFAHVRAQHNETGVGGSTVLEWEKYGLSQREWQKIEQARMPIEKVKLLLEAGITISEYFRYPWLNMDISEEEWIRRRRAGQRDEDISARRPVMTRSDAKLLKSFVFPGYYQMRRGEHGKGWGMVGIAGLSLTWTCVQVGREETFLLPLTILLGDLVWSFGDVLHHSRSNPDIQRFTRAGPSPGLSLVITF